MQTTVDLKRMSLSDKLCLMEALRDELCRREEEVPVPEWHKLVLNEHEERRLLVNGEGAKEKIRKRVS
ncbi:MAG: hypothetical protein ABI651_08210 [Verrucomicrobiota bacterium]